MNRRNYQRELDRLIAERQGARPRVLLHACCGICSSSVLEYLRRYFDVTILWYNPNLYPAEEFTRRYDTLLEMLEKMGWKEQVPVLFEDWRHAEYLACARGFEREPEGGKRCEQCFRLRLAECARIAKERGFDYFCTTLTLSRHKDAVLINRLGEEIAAEAGVPWLVSDFKKQGREMRSTRLAEQYDLYRQLYCGCEFSLEKRENHGAEA